MSGGNVWLRYKVLFAKYPIMNIMLGFLIFLFTITMVITGGYIQEGYNIQVGSIAPKRFVAPREIENKFATQRRIQEAEESVKPLFKQDHEVERQAVEQIQSLFTAIKPIVYTEEEEEENVPFQKQQTAIFLTDAEYKILISLDHGQRALLEEQIIEIVESILVAGVKEETKLKSVLDIKDEFNKLPWDPEIKNLGNTIGSAVIQTNIFIDEEATKQAIEKKVTEVRPVMILRGQKIIDEGEIITEEIYSILDSLSLIAHQYQRNYIPIIGSILVITLLLSSLYAYIYTFHKKIVHSKKDTLLIFTIYCITLLIMRVMIHLPYVFIPISIAGMLIAILLNVQLAVVINIVISIVGSLIDKGDQQFLLFFIISGTLAALLIIHTYQRSKVLWVGFFISILNGIVMFGLGLLFEKEYSIQLLIYSLFAFANGILSVIITMGSLPFWETVFDAITPIKLLDLTNPDQPLLRKLLLEAPGTYHHSLIVANLAEMAASDIGCNPILARVGAYYHDIGKLQKPQYFKENQIVENPHDFAEPDVSAKIIIQHGKSGSDMAETYKLPKVIKDIIVQHHGTTLVKYFYYKAVKQNPKKTISEALYRYPGPKPQSKEAAIVMLADTVEAAVRSVMPEGKTMEDIENLIKGLIRDKLDDGQLSDSTMTIKDLEIIRASFIKVFSGMYHERIPYPKADPKEEKKDDSVD